MVSNVYVSVHLGASTTEQIQTSPDGITWTKRSSPIDTHGGQCVAYGAGRFVAFGVDNSDDTTTIPIVSSNDGLSWTAYTCPQPATAYVSVTYSSALHLWVALGFDGEIITSPDAQTWTSQTTLGSNSDGWSCVTFGAGLFVAVGAQTNSGSGTMIETSPDGIIWTVRAAPGKRLWSSVIFAGGQFVAVNRGEADQSPLTMLSADGISWTGEAAANASQWVSMAYDGTTYIAVAGDAGGQIMTSTTGTSWSLTSVADAIDCLYLIRAGGKWVAGLQDLGDAQGSSILYSSDGSTWTLGTTDILENAWSLAFSSCPTVSCGSPPSGTVGTPYSHTFPTDAVSVFYSISAGSLPPGLSLDPATGIISGTPTANGIYSFTVRIQAAQVMATGDDGSFSDSEVVITSPDGLTWAQQTTAITDSGWSVIYSAALALWVNGADVAGTTEQIQTSPDGVSGNWTARSSPADSGGWVKKMVSGADKIVAIFQKFGVINVMTSTDGITWMQQTIPAGEINGSADVAYSPDLDRYVIADFNDGGGNPGVITSTDGITWTFHSTPETLPCFGLAWGAGLFVMVGDTQGSGDHLMTSPDGFTWTVQPDPGGSPQGWAGIAYGNGQFVIVSDDVTTDPGNQAATSTDGLTWTIRATPGSVKTWDCVTFGYGLWLSGAANSPNSQPLMMSSDNGVTWSLIPALGFSFGYVAGIAFGPVACSNTVGCSITIGAGATIGNTWRGGMQQRIGNTFG